MLISQLEAVEMGIGQWGSVAAIVIGVCILMEFVKKYMGEMPWFRKVPIFVYVTALSLLLVLITKRLLFVEHSMASLIWDTLSCALSSSGFYTWIRQARQPLETATGTVTGKKITRKKKAKKLP